MQKCSPNQPPPPVGAPPAACAAKASGGGDSPPKSPPGPPPAWFKVQRADGVENPVGPPAIPPPTHMARAQPPKGAPLKSPPMLQPPAVGIQLPPPAVGLGAPPMVKPQPPVCPVARAKPPPPPVPKAKAVPFAPFADTGPSVFDNGVWITVDKMVQHPPPYMMTKPIRIWDGLPDPMGAPPVLDPAFDYSAWTKPRVHAQRLSNQHLRQKLGAPPNWKFESSKAGYPTLIYDASEDGVSLFPGRIWISSIWPVTFPASEWLHYIGATSQYDRLEPVSLLCFFISIMFSHWASIIVGLVTLADVSSHRF